MTWCSRVLIALLLIPAGSVSAQPLDLLMVAPPALAGAAREIEGLDRRPLIDGLARAGLQAPPRVRVRLLTNDDMRAREAPSWVVGQASGTVDIVIFPERVSSYPYGSLGTVFRHEVVHLALSRAAGRGHIPRWFHEGVAVAIESDWGVVDDLRLLMAAAGGPDVSDVARLFASDNRPETTEAYLLAAALVDDLRRRHGPALPGAIASEVARGVAFEQAFAMHTGETPNEAAAIAWATYHQVTTWLPVVTSVNTIWTFILILAFVAFAMRLRQRARRRRQGDDES